MTEVQDGWKVHILPFELVQESLMPEDVREIRILEERLSEVGFSSIRTVRKKDEIHIISHK